MLESVILKNISAAKAELSALIERVEKGEEVLIARAGRPVARLVPYEGIARRREPGALRGQIDIAPDFDDLPDDLARAFGAGHE
ncbi:MAG: type II toxin-antitoxin system prevent-host-death family antitoxin [Candidatus Wallbacteria bacterium]|nr:type II toxin-antitoxin system prevent-host-death family antitoxin [Candidatus Wallbacteria bacterium]